MLTLLIMGNATVATAEDDENEGIYGKVTDSETGHPIADTYIRIENDEFGQNTTSDISGDYSIECPSGDYDLMAYRDGYDWYETQVTIENGEWKLHDIQLTRKGESVYGKVTDYHTEKPIESALVTLRNNDNYYSTETDCDGEYNINCDSGDYTLKVEHDDYPTYSDNITVETGESKEYDVKLAKCWVYGTVKDSVSQDPIENATIQLKNENLEYETQSDTEGYYEIGCQPGSYDIIVKKSGYQKYQDTIEIDAGERQKHNVEMDRSSETSVVEGYVTDSESGEAIEDVNVCLVDEYENRTTQTDEDGYYRFQCYPGDYQISAHHDEYYSYEEDITVGQHEVKRHDIELQPKPKRTAKVYGTITDERTGEPVEDVWVDLEHKTKNEQYRVYSDVHGDYEIECYGGDYEISFAKSGYNRVRDSISIDTNENLQYDLVMDDTNPTSRIYGTVVDEHSGEPIENPHLMIKSDGSYYNISGDKAGNYDAEIQEGDVIVRAWESGYFTYVGEEFFLDYYEEIEYDIQLTPIHLEGYVSQDLDRGELGDPISGVIVSLHGENDYSGTTNEEGFYYILCDEGEYTVNFSHNSYIFESSKVQVNENAFSYDTQLIPIGIYGQIVSSENDEPVENAEIVIFTDEEMSEYSAITDSYGNYMIICPKGTYIIMVSKSDFNFYESYVEVENELRKLHVVLTPNILYGQVLDEETSQPVEGAVIKIALEDQSIEINVTTDENGQYSIILSAGSYKIIVTCDGYETHTDTIGMLEFEDVEYAAELSHLPPPEELHVNIENPDTAEAGNTVILSIEVVTDNTTPVVGVDIEAITSNDIVLEPENGLTDEDGMLVISFSAPVVDDETLVDITIHAVKENYLPGQSTCTITILPEDNGDDEPEYTFTVAPHATHSMKSGESIGFEFWIENTGNTDDDYAIFGSAGNIAWCELTQTVVDIDADEKKFVVGSITVPEGTSAGVYDITITVRSIADNSLEEEYAMSVVVEESNESSSDNGYLSIGILSVTAGILVGLVLSAFWVLRR